LQKLEKPFLSHFTQLSQLSLKKSCFYLTLFDIGSPLSITVHAGNVPRSSQLSNLNILTMKENSLLNQVKKLMPISIVTDLQGSAIRMLWRYGSGRAKLGKRKVIFVVCLNLKSWDCLSLQGWRLSRD
jgi:hypothetical protein